MGQSTNKLVGNASRDEHKILYRGEIAVTADTVVNDMYFGHGDEQILFANAEDKPFSLDYYVKIESDFGPTILQHKGSLLTFNSDTTVQTLATLEHDFYINFLPRVYALNLRAEVKTDIAPNPPIITNEFTFRYILYTTLFSEAGVLA